MHNGQQQLVNLTIDGVQLQVPKGTLLVEAAKQIDREIPIYCYHTKMGPAGLCRICLVEIEGMPKLQIACNTQATEGMVVHTQSEKAADGRRAVLEVYLVNHPLDCPICDKGGECDLQDYAMAYGQGFSRSADPKISKPKAIDLGPTIVLDEERCVVCQRCIRFDDIIVGERELVLKDRGVRNIIATATGESYRHNFTGNVTELCPVGALTSKTYRFKSRPWDLRRTETTCTQCSVGCQMHVDVRVGKVMRVMSVEKDDAISDGWLCDRGRYNIGFYDDARRLKQPLYRKDGELIQIGWDDAIELWARAIKEAAPQKAAAIGGGRLTNEEAYLLQHVMRAIGIGNLDWRAGRQRYAAVPKGGSIVDLERAGAIIVVGESPAERAPIFDLRVRKTAFRHGAKLIRIACAEPRYPAPIPFIEAPTAQDAVAALPQGVERIAVVWDGVDPSALQDVMTKLPATAQVSTYVTGEQPNARGAEAMGMHPAFLPGYRRTEQGKGTPEIFAAARNGELAALSIFGANPVLHFPDGALVRDALQRTPFVAVSDLFMTETAELASLVLPALGSFEKTGTTMNLAGDVLPLNAAHSLESPAGALSDLEMIAALAERFDVTLPSADELDREVIAHLAHAAPPQSDVEETRGQTPPPSAGELEFRVTVQSRIFAGGGTSAHDEALLELRPLPEAAFSPEDAAALQVCQGDYVDLAAGEQTMHDLLVEVRPGVQRGVVGVIGGLPDCPANLFGDGSIVRVRNARSQALTA